MFRMALHWQILLGMILGAAIGLSLNAGLGRRATSIDGARLTEKVQQVTIEDTPDLIRIQYTDPLGAQRAYVVDPTRQAPDSVATLDKLKQKDELAYQLFQKYGRSWARWTGDLSQGLGGLFLQLLKMVAVPLIITSLITGIMGIGRTSELGRMFGLTILYYVSTSFLAIVTGLAMVNLIRPGLNTGINISGAEDAGVSSDLGTVLWDQLNSLIPDNLFQAFVEPDFLGIISFSLAFAIFATLVGGTTAERLRQWFEAAFEVIMAMTMAIIKLAPLGVFFLMIYVTSTQGPAVFLSLAWYMLAVVAALAIHALVVLPCILRFVAKRNPLQFAKAMSPALLTAFSSASSNGTLPLTLASVEQRAGVSNRISSFVLPLGATVNMDGTALYEAVAVLFIAQLYYGEPLALSQQIVVAVTALLASIGAAGIPHAGLVMMVIILQAVNLPVEMQGIILAVDRVLDMCRTMVNVWSDSCGCAVLARIEESRLDKPPVIAPEKA